MKVCVIGTGRMGRRHIAAIQGLGFEVAGIFDPLPEAISIARIEHNIPVELCFASAEAMLDSQRPDGVVIASTAPSHCEYVCLASSAGVKYILCEKPMAVSIVECDKMIISCQKSGSTLAINHQRRFMNLCTRIKELCDSEEFGGLRSVTIAASNFGLAMNGSHYFEMFRYLTGSDIRSVSFSMDDEIVPNPRGIEYEDRSGQLFATTSSNHRLYMEIGGDQGHGINISYGCRNGHILIDELAGSIQTNVRQREYRDLPTTQGTAPSNQFAFEIEPANIIEATQDMWRAMIDGQNYADGTCGRQTIVALVAAIVSGENDGLRVVVKDGLPENRVFPWA